MTARIRNIGLGILGLALIAFEAVVLGPESEAAWLLGLARLATVL